MLDDANVLKQRDPSGALQIAAMQYEQVNFKPEMHNRSTFQPVYNIVIAGMGGSALAASLVKIWLKSELAEPLEIVRTYDLPAYVNENTLVVCSSYSGTTEETISCVEQARIKGAQIVVIASGGKLIEYANGNNITSVKLPSVAQPRMAVIYNICTLMTIFAGFGVVSDTKIDEISGMTDWLKDESERWTSEVPTDKNYAKQLAMQAVGKTAVFYGGSLTAPIANKFKLGWNENAKNVAFWNEIPEFSHNEFIGWTSHPIEKPFVIFDIVSNLENPRILKRFEVTDRLLSGKRPKSNVINLAGKSLVEQLLWGNVLADFASIYLAILNEVDPTPVALVDKLKQELG